VRLASPIAPKVQALLQQAPATEPIALLTDLAPHANACLVWEPGQSEPTAISPPDSDGARVSACFLLIVPEQGDDHVKLVEDGVALLLTSSIWASVRQALLSGRSNRIQPSDGTPPVVFSWTTETGGQIDAATI
jgi:hypothetical protein